MRENRETPATPSTDGGEGRSDAGEPPVKLTGIVLREARPGWLSLDLPPLEVWAEPLKQLSVQQRQRVETPEFYQLLQREVTRRYLARLRSPG